MSFFFGSCSTFGVIISQQRGQRRTGVTAGLAKSATWQGRAV